MLTAATRALLMLLALTLAGCSALVPRLETPELSVTSVEVIKADLLQQQLRVRMKVRNPNDRALPVRGITYTVEVQGEKFAEGDSERDFVVPALGEMEFDVNVYANAAPVLLKYALGGRQAAVDYRIAGKVQLAAGLLRSIPFSQTGSFRLR